MLATMLRKDFETHDDEALMAACTESAMIRMQGGSLSEKTEVLSQLNADQRALCMFRVMYPAAHSEEECNAWIDYLHSQPGYWDGVVGGLRFFGETSLIGQLEELSGRIEAGERKPVARDRFVRFQNGVADSLARIASRIRSHPQHFVQLTE